MAPRNPLTAALLVFPAVALAYLALLLLQFATPVGGVGDLFRGLLVALVLGLLLTLWNGTPSQRVAIVLLLTGYLLVYAAFFDVFFRCGSVERFTFAWTHSVHVGADLGGRRLLFHPGEVSMSFDDGCVGGRRPFELIGGYLLSGVGATLGYLRTNSWPNPTGLRVDTSSTTRAVFALTAVGYTVLVVLQLTARIGGLFGLLRTILLGLGIVLLITLWRGTTRQWLGVALLFVGFAVFYVLGVLPLGFVCLGGPPDDYSNYVLLFDTLDHRYFLAESTGSGVPNADYTIELWGSAIYAGSNIVQDVYWQCGGALNPFGLLIGWVLTAAGIAHGVVSGGDS